MLKLSQKLNWTALTLSLVTLMALLLVACGGGAEAPTTAPLAATAVTEAPATKVTAGRGYGSPGNKGDGGSLSNTGQVLLVDMSARHYSNSETGGAVDGCCPTDSHPSRAGQRQGYVDLGDACGAHHRGRRASEL